uniref:BED-type domain-containing protein n=1 Tax=Bactrocera dorsalis TaxID=27457 RepID=A0A034WE77_BACDO
MSQSRSGRKSSFVWNFFDADSNEKARCRICKRIFSRKGCCTSGLITHLKKRHTEVFLLHLNKGLVCLEDDENDDIKKEHDQNHHATKDNLKKKKHDRENVEKEESSIDLQSVTSEHSSDSTLVFPEDDEPIKRPIEQLCLEEDEYPIVNIERKQGRDNPFQSASTNQHATTQMETLLTKQLQIQAKLYKEIKEKLEQINTHIKESERINRKKFRLKVEKLRLKKEEFKKKELHRKEMQRLRLLELEILNKKNVQDQLHFNRL